METEKAIRFMEEVVAKQFSRRQLVSEAIAMSILALKEVEKHKETFEWCARCKEYDCEKHCCHRWCKVISHTVEEIKQGYAIVNCRECIYRNTKDCPVNGDFIERNPWFYCGMGEKHEKTDD